MNHRIIIGLFVFVLFHEAAFAQPSENKKADFRPGRYDFTPFRQKEVSLSDSEMKLYELIIDYRANYGLDPIPLSVALTYVAQTHAGDLTENYQPGGRCNLNSWSKKGTWSPCCYLKDHSMAECMWNKPRELTSYAGDGFEIVYSNIAYYTPADALDKWKKNPLHNCVLINTGNWEKTTWKAIGIGIYGNHVTVWLGKEPDYDGEPEIAGKN